ncbi:MAG: hypothetical protein R2754_08400 [Microthrixaceae bacterium]
MAGPAHESDRDDEHEGAKERVGDPQPNTLPEASKDAEMRGDTGASSDTEMPGDESGSGLVPDDEASADDPPGAPDQAAGSARWLMRVRSALGIAVVGLALVAIVVYGLPPSPLRGKIPSWAYTVGDATSLNQNWALFAPDPPTSDVRLDFVVTDADGTVTVESLPSGPIWLPTVRSERWRKVRERVTPTSANERWPEVLDWSLAKLRASGRNPTTIELRRRWTDRVADDPTSEGTERTFAFARLEVPTGNYVVLDPDAPGAVKEQPADATPAGVVESPADASPDGRAEQTDQ